MATLLADTLEPRNTEFPVAKAEHITVKIKDTVQNLETTLNSMSGGYTVEELPEASAELFGKVYQYIGETTDTLTKGYFYVCTTDENAEYIWKQTEVQKPGLPDPEAKDKVLVSTENAETSELEWSQVDNSNSYSTQEVKTGGKWIDGKPIYRNVLKNTKLINGGEIGWGGLESKITSLNIQNCIACYAIIDNMGMRYLQFMPNNGGFISYYSGIPNGAKVVMEYTKTTD